MLCLHVFVCMHVGMYIFVYVCVRMCLCVLHRYYVHSCVCMCLHLHMTLYVHVHLIMMQVYSSIIGSEKVCVFPRDYNTFKECDYKVITSLLLLE